MKLLSASVGGAVERYTDLTMVCKVDPEGKKIYQAKWYKNGQEFYRYQPGENPPGKAFDVEGTRVNVSHVLSASSCTKIKCAMCGDIPS